ncbi:MAG: hypothetical protein II350_03815 [Clostridia bacterium]|nr:hypothetical protein [Clostridia bacterium]
MTLKSFLPTLLQLRLMRRIILLRLGKNIKTAKAAASIPKIRPLTKAINDI